MKVLKVKTKSPYEILIREGLLEEIPENLKNLNFGKIAIITDTVVEQLYAQKLCQDFFKKNIRAEIFSFPERQRVLYWLFAPCQGVGENFFKNFWNPSCAGCL